MKKEPMTEFDVESGTSSRELVEDSLQTLKLFLDRLADLSLSAADQVGSDPGEGDYRKLIDGIEILSDTVTQVKALLQLGPMPAITLLEADLLSILRELMAAAERRDHPYRIVLLRQQLPRNLEQWALEGIPALIRSRDS